MKLEGRLFFFGHVHGFHFFHVCVIASVYRHNPRDFDDEGHRIPCPRFGGVTCGEHIRIEPTIFEKFCDGQRVAPRHILVDLDGKESFDVYYRNDTASVLADVQEGHKKFPAPPPAIVRGDRPVVERVGSREVSDRTAVEEAYQKGDAAQRKALLEAALQAKQAEPLDLLRLAVFGFDPDLSKVARKALSEVETPAATKLIVEALKVPMEPAERDALLGALKRLGINSPLARWLAVVHQGVAGRSATAQKAVADKVSFPPGYYATVDPSKWTAAPGTATPPPPADYDALEAARAKGEEATKQQPGDATALLDLAETSIALAREAQRKFDDDPKRARQNERHLYADARRLAREAAAVGAPAARTNAVLAVAAYQSGDRLEAYARAAEAAPNVVPGDPSFTALAVVTIFAESRFQAIRAAVREKKDWPPEWLTDLHAAYEVLLRHPLGRDEQVVWHYDFLVWLGADDEAGRVLAQGLGRFKASQTLHDRLLTRALAERGPEGLEAAYKALLAEQDAAPELYAFAANASVVAAEHHRRMKAFQPAVAAYGRALELYEKALVAEPASTEAWDHRIALALAGRARVAYQLNDDEHALEDLVASLGRRPGSAGTRDGVGITPGETAQMLRARLKTAGKDEQVGRLDKALEKVDPELLKFDRE